MSRRMGLAGSVGSPGLWVMGVAASGPAIVLVGGVTTMYAATGLVTVPVGFLVLAVALAPVTMAVVAASRHLGHAATTYAVLARGFGGVAGVVGGAVAWVSYTAIGCSLYGLLGWVLASHLGGVWWAWALAAWALVAGLGGVPLTMNVAVIGAGVAVQLVVMVAVVASALFHPSHAVSGAGLNLAALLHAGGAALGALFAFGVAAFIGFESPASYVEETRNPRLIIRSSFAVLGFLGVCYTLAAWAVGVGYGPDGVVDAARDPDSGLPLGLLGGWAPLGQLVLVVGIVLSMLSFHHLTCRYSYRLGRDRVLPAGLGRVGRGTRAGSPTTALGVQSAAALLVILVAAVAGVDPITGLFVPASTLAAVGVLAILTASAGAAGRFFARGGGGNERWCTRKAAPVLGVICGGGVLAVVVANLHTLLGVGAGAASTWLLPGLVAVTGVAGAARGCWLRRRCPDVYAGIGFGEVRHAARLDPRLAELTL